MSAEATGTGVGIPLRRSADMTMSAGFGLAAAAFGGWYLWTRGHPAWALLAAGVGIPVCVHFIRRAREALCPGCGAAIDATLDVPVRCKACPPRAYWRRAGERLEEVPPGAMEAIPTFELYLWDLDPERPFRLPWDGACLTCRKPAAGTKRIRVSAETGGVPGVYVKVARIEVPVPHCVEHAGDFREGVGGALRLRSYDAWKELVRLNGRA